MIFYSTLLIIYCFSGFQSSYCILISSILVHCVLIFTNKLLLIPEESKYSEENSVERRCGGNTEIAQNGKW